MTKIQRVPGTFTITDPAWPVYVIPDIDSNILADFDSHDLTVATGISSWPRHGGSLATLTLDNVSTTSSRKPDAVTDATEGTVLSVTAANSQFIRTAADITVSTPAPPLTFAFRVKARSLVASGVVRLMSSVTGYVLNLDHTSAGALRMGVGTDGELSSPTGVLAADGAWHNLVFVANGPSSAIYKDGTLLVSGITGASPSTGLLRRMTLGAASNAGAGYWDGWYRRARVYARALTASEVTLLNADWS